MSALSFTCTAMSHCPHHHLNLWIHPCTCRRSHGPTKAGPWTAWCCATRRPGGWGTTSPSPPQRESMSMASTWREPAGTAAAANSLTPSPKSSSRWCPWSGCTLRITVRFTVWWRVWIVKSNRKNADPLIMSFLIRINFSSLLSGSVYPSAPQHLHPTQSLRMDGCNI